MLHYTRQWFYNGAHKITLKNPPLPDTECVSYNGVLLDPSRNEYSFESGDRRRIRIHPENLVIGGQPVCVSYCYEHEMEFISDH